MANFIERLINLTVDNGEANAALNKTATNLDKVDKNTTKVTQSTKTMTKETHSSTEAIVKNGGAMGILNELTGGLAMTFKDASEAMEIAGVSLNSFKGIMIATGIGALVIAVGYLASNWEDVANAITGAADAQEKYNLEVAKLENTRRVLSNINNETIANIQLKKEQAIARGASKKELLDFDKRILAAKKEQLRIDNESLTSQSTLNDSRIAGDSEYQSLLENKLETEKGYNRLLGERAELEKTPAGRLLNKVSAGVLENIRKNKEAAEQELLAYERTNENFVKRGEINQKLTENELQSNLLRIESQQTFNSYLDKTVEKKQKISKVEESQLSKDYKKLKEINDLAQKRIDLIAAGSGAALEPGNLPEIVDTDLMRADKFKFVIDEENKWYDERLSAFEQFNKGITNSFTLTEEEKKQILYDSKMKQIEIEQEKWDFITNASSNAAQDILNIVSLFGEKSKKDSKTFAIASVIIEQARATGIAINNLVAANAKAVAASPLTGGQPWVTINTVSTALGIAGGIAGAAKSIRAINAETLTNDSGGGTTGAGAAAPQAQFNIVGASGNNQLAAAIGAAQNQPVNAYVVGSDMTTQQALDRNRITTATFLVLLPFIGLFSIFII